MHAWAVVHGGGPGLPLYVFHVCALRAGQTKVRARPAVALPLHGLPIHPPCLNPPCLSLPACLQRDYLERDANDQQLYKYLA